MEKWSAANLIILGLLMEKPMSAYEMAHIIDSQIIGHLIKISPPTVYKNIKALHEKGRLTAETIREGEQPEKKIYAVTEKGKEHFLQLMGYFSSKLTPFFLESNAFLLNIDKLDKRRGLKMLQNLKKHIEDVQGWIKRHEREAGEKGIFFAGLAIIKQHRMMLDSLATWIDEVIEDYQKTKKPGAYSVDRSAGFKPPF